MKYRMNLVPEGYRSRKVLDWEKLLLVAVLLFFMTGLVTLGIMYEKRFIDLQNSIGRLSFQKNQLLFEDAGAQKILDRIARVEAEDARGREVLSILDVLVQDRIQWSRVLAQVTYIVPEGAWITALSSSGDGASRKVNFKGKALSNKWVARFLFYLENHPDFNEVRLEYSRQVKMGDRELYNFEVNAGLAPASGRL